MFAYDSKVLNPCGLFENFVGAKSLKFLHRKHHILKVGKNVVVFSEGTNINQEKLIGSFTEIRGGFFKKYIL